MITSNHSYNRLDKKSMILILSVVVLYFVFCFVTCFNMCENIEFYKNSKHVSSIVKNIKETDEKGRVIRVSYVVDKKTYVKDINYDIGELGNLEIGDTIGIFYNGLNPSEAYITTKTVGSIYVTMTLLILLGVVFVLFIVYYIWQMKMNKKLIDDNNYIMANFYRLEFRNSANPFTKGRINRVYCKAVIDDQKFTFKSMPFAGKPKPLNDTSIIKVYVNKGNYNRYLMDINDIMQ